jgi:hypothetical protein
MCNPIKLFAAVLEEFNDDSKWKDAVLGKIKTISNTKVGSVGQAFIERLCGELSMPCSFPTNKKGKRLAQNPWDIKIADIEFELKTATEDTNNHFQFNHVRYHRPYEGLLCLGVAPANLYFGIWSKGEVATGKAGSLVSMEKGASASYKLTKAPNQLFEIAVFQSEMEKFASQFKKQGN